LTAVLGSTEVWRQTAHDIAQEPREEMNELLHEEVQLLGGAEAEREIDVEGELEANEIRELNGRDNDDFELEIRSEECELEFEFEVEIGIGIRGDVEVGEMQRVLEPEEGRKENEEKEYHGESEPEPEFGSEPESRHAEIDSEEGKQIFEMSFAL
jgi:hypothetical protein